MDASIFRQFPIGGDRRLEFRLETFNLFNHPTLGKPNTDLNNGSSFGTINGTASTERQLQLGGKFIF